MRGKRRRRRRSRGFFLAILALLSVAGVSWYLNPGEKSGVGVEPYSLSALPMQPISTPPPAAIPASTDQPSSKPTETPRLAESSPDKTEPVAAVQPTLSATPAPRSGDSLIETGRAALASGDLLSARNALNSALAAGLPEPAAGQVRNELIQLGATTIFSARILPGDELVDRYVIKTGDNLAKIANQYSITADLVAALNGIPDKNRIREGQVLKVLRGPLHAVVSKRAYRLDIYLGDVLVRSFPVGLGLDDSTPTGGWKVKNKLENPTYYPPRGGAIISADDPDNPLGERWIGLEGVSGEALAQERYGIHGTNEPESIGKSISLGCVRMYNPDVEQVYSYLVEGKSTVTVVE